MAIFVLIHLVIDLAAPSLPGAFRFNPDESVLAVRVQPVQVEVLRPLQRADLKQVEPPRVEPGWIAQQRPGPAVADIAPHLPRREFSIDHPSPSLSDDH